MTTSDVCPHDENLTPASCAECMYEGRQPVSRVTLSGHPFNAKYHGECALCDQPIDPEQVIIRRSDGSFIHYRHAPQPRR